MALKLNSLKGIYKLCRLIMVHLHLVETYFCAKFYFISIMRLGRILHYFLFKLVDNLAKNRTNTLI